MASLLNGLAANATGTGSAMVGSLGCSTPVLVGAAVGGVSCVAGGSYLLWSVISKTVNKVCDLASKLYQYSTNFSYRNDTVHYSQLVGVSGCALMLMAGGYDNPMATVLVGSATLAAEIAVLRLASSMRGTMPEFSPHHLDGVTGVKFGVQTVADPQSQSTTISCDSVGKALELLKTNLTYRRRHIRDFEGHDVHAVRAYYAAHPLVGLDMALDEAGEEINLASYAKELLWRKYGLHPDDPKNRAELTPAQQANRKSLLETMGTNKKNPKPLIFPPSPTLGITGQQLTEWLTDIRERVYAETKHL
jgi:hypothetical protein